MKNKTNLKIILAFLLGLVIAGSIGVYATIKIQASEIGYKDGTVESALNQLYNNINGSPNISNGLIPAGIKEVKAIVVRCTDNVNYTNLSIEGDIIETTETKHLNDKLVSNKYHIYIDEIEIKTTGGEGTITISGSGGSGNRVLYYYLYY